MASLDSPARLPYLPTDLLAGVPFSGGERDVTALTMNARISALIVLSLGWVAARCAAEPPVPERIAFNRDVRPILSEDPLPLPRSRCEPAQGQAPARSPRRGLEEGVFVPGKPDESELIKRIGTTRDDDLMPPRDSHKQLTERQKEVLQRWIAQGAAYQLHCPTRSPPKWPCRMASTPSMFWCDVG